MLGHIVKNITARRSRARIVDKLLALGLVAERRELYKKRRKKLAPSSLVSLSLALQAAPPPPKRSSQVAHPDGSCLRLFWLVPPPPRFPGVVRNQRIPLRSSSCPLFSFRTPLNFSLRERSPKKIFARKIWKKKKTCQRKRVMRMKRKRRTQKQIKPSVAQSFQRRPLGKACLRKVRPRAGRDVSGGGVGSLSQ